jgi:hypothetical protein
MLPYTTYHIPEPGKNQTPAEGKWLFFLHNEDITDDKTRLLSKIATALQATFERDVAVLAVPDPVSFHAIISAASGLVISFGVPLPHIGLNIELAEPGLRMMERYTCILTYPLVELEQHANHKKSLWRDMQLYLATRNL